MGFKTDEIRLKDTCSHVMFFHFHPFRFDLFDFIFDALYIDIMHGISSYEWIGMDSYPDLIAKSNRRQ